MLAEFESKLGGFMCAEDSLIRSLKFTYEATKGFLGLILIDALVATLNVSFSRYGASSERLQDVLSHACKQS